MRERVECGKGEGKGGLCKRGGEGLSDLCKR